MSRFRRPGILFRAFSLFALSSCGVSELSAGFQSGAKMQESLDNQTLQLMNRSPAVASNDYSLLASEANKFVIDRSPRITLGFSGLSDLRSTIGNAYLTVQESFFNRRAPTFFEWAGKFISWRDNSDYKILFTYYHAQKTIDYVDYLFAEGLIPLEYIHYWKKQGSSFAVDAPYCDDPDPLISAYCVPVAEILPALPLTIYADDVQDPEGYSMTADATHFCPSFNVNFNLNGESYCVDNTAADFDSWKLEDGALKRVMTFFRHQQSPVPLFNPADDADTIYHEMGHVLQLVMNGRALENPVGRNGVVDAILEGVSDFFAGVMTDDSALFRYSLANFKSAYPEAFASGTQHNQRDLTNTLRLPDAFAGFSDHPDAPHVGNSHMSGRVIAGLLYDLKLFYDGETPSSVSAHCVDFPDLDICSMLFSPIQIPAGKDWSSWDIVLGLVMRTFAGQPSSDSFNVDNSTFHHFGVKLLETCADLATEFNCPESELTDLLVLRGLMTERPLYPPTLAAPPVPYDTEAERVYSLGPIETGDLYQTDWGIETLKTSLGRVDYQPDYSGAPASGYWANDDLFVDPCEVMVIFPNLINKTHIMENRAKGNFDDTDADPDTMGADIYDIKVELLDFTGFLPFTVGDNLIENVSDPGYIDHRIIPWLKPGESTGFATIEDANGDRDAYSPIRDPESSFYKVHQDYRVSKKISKMKATSSTTDFPTALGWILRAPKNLNDVASATFRVHYKVYNQLTMYDDPATSNFVEGIPQLNFEFTQSMTVDGSESFCDR